MECAFGVKFGNHFVLNLAPRFNIYCESWTPAISAGSVKDSRLGSCLEAQLEEMDQIQATWAPSKDLVIINQALYHLFGKKEDINQCGWLICELLPFNSQNSIVQASVVKLL